MSATSSELATLFLEFSRKKLLGQYWPRMRACVGPLKDAQIWWRPNEASNSIGNLILHLNGNVGQWIVTAFSGQEDRRNRPAEFSAQGSMAKSELLDLVGATMEQATEVMARLTEADLLARYEIQGYKVSGLDAVYQVVEHFGLHYGQILYIAKNLCGRDLGFYSELNTTGRAS
jgi:hypothetical protein